MADRRGYVVAQADIVLHLFTAQIDIAIAQADIFPCPVIFGNLKRDNIRCTLKFCLGDIDLNLTGIHFRIHSFICAGFHLAGNRHDRFVAPVFHFCQQWRVFLNHTLGQTKRIAQINEEHAAMVTNFMDPAGKFNGFANLVFTKLGAVMCSVLMHVSYIPLT